MHYSEIKYLVETNGPFGIGETKRFNHTACPEGTDTRRRWYVTRENDGTWDVYKGYCHNCGKGAVHREMTMTPKTVWPTGPQLPEDDNIKLPADCVPMTAASVPWEARHWFEKYGVLNTRLATDVQWSPQHQRIVLPVYNQCGGARELRGYQLRRVGNWPGPKYMTVKGKKPLEWLTPAYESVFASHIVFVEDMVSFYKLMNVNNVWANPLLGLHFRGEHIIKVLKAFPKAKPVVWFDNDLRVPWAQGPTKIPSEHLAALCAAVGRPATIIEDMSDPKHYTDDKINARLQRIP